MFCCAGCRKSKSKNILQVTPANQKDSEYSPCQKDPIFKSKNGVEPPIVEKVGADLQTQPASVETTTDTETDNRKDTAPSPQGSVVTSEEKAKEFEQDIVKKSSSQEPTPPPPLVWEPIKVPEARETFLASELSNALAIAAEERARLNSGEMSAEQMTKSIDRLQTAVLGLERVTTRLENIANSSGKLVNSTNSAEVLSPFVVAYDDIIKGPLATFIALSSKINGNVKTQATLVQEAFNAQRSFLVQVSRSKKPPNDQMSNLLNPTSSKLQAIQDLREKNRRDPFFHHLSAISESIPALGWVTLTTPTSYIKEMSDSALFYTNRVLKDFKEKDATHVEWTKAWINALKELQSYVKEYHTTGLSWNPQGGDAKVVPSGPAGFVAPPPPPPPPPCNMSSPSKDANTAEIDRLALFNEINKGTDITKGLKKVSDDMKTHKNPTLRKDGEPSAKSPSSTSSSSKKTFGGNGPVANTPIIELQDKKWIVEYQTNNPDIQITDTNMRQTVYMYKCKNSVTKITGKINSIVVDNCTKCGIVFDDVISSIEFINCSSVQAQVTGKVPTVSIEKTDGCMVYLSSNSLQTEIITAKSSEVNVLVPKDNGDYTEFFIPEQFKSTYNGKSMATQCCES